MNATAPAHSASVAPPSGAPPAAMPSWMPPPGQRQPVPPPPPPATGSEGAPPPPGTSPPRAPPTNMPRLRGPPPPLELGLHPRPLLHPLHFGPPPPRIPFFIREIYKNGFLKRLPHNEKKSSALSKLLKSDRYWVVFSVHDDLHPFLELWNEPTEVASKPPHYIFPLAVCQHISPSLLPADNEWSFVINFETVAIRFSCNSRDTMVEWVECIRHKLGELGILNPKGNLYSKIPSSPTKLVRNPMSPLPSPPQASRSRNASGPAAAASPPPPSSGKESKENIAVTVANNGGRNRLSIVDASDESNQTFTTSIYLNQTPPATPQISSTASATTSATAKPTVSTTVKTTAPSKTTETGARPKTVMTSSPSRSKTSTTISTRGTKSTVASSLSLDGDVSASGSSTPTAAASHTTTANGATPTTSSVYLNKAGPTRHVTVIPINRDGKAGEDHSPPKSPRGKEGEEPEEAFYDAIADPPPPPPPQDGEKKKKSKEPSSSKGKVSPTRNIRSPDQHLHPPRAARERQRRGAELVTGSPPKSSGEKAVFRRCSDRKQVGAGGASDGAKGYNIQQRVRKRTQRSSSLGPLLDEHNISLSRSVNTNSLESLDSNPRQAMPKGDPAAVAAGARSRPMMVQRRPLVPTASLPAAAAGGAPAAELSAHPHHSGRQPPYHSLLPTGLPPHIPLPGLTCQLTFHGGPPPPPPPAAPQQPPLPPPPPAGDRDHPPPHQQQQQQQPRPTLREQQVIRLRQEIAHPSGVRLTLRRRDCHNSLALVEMFGCLWVAGWKQRDFPVLYNAFHVGDQILTAGGGSGAGLQQVRTASEFAKLTKLKPPPSEQHVEIIIRRTPFAQVFNLRREVDGQPLGIVAASGNTAPNDIREIVPGSPAANHGMTAKVRSMDGQSLVSWTLSEVNGRPLSLFAKEGEAAAERLQTVASRDVSVVVQPSDFILKLRKQMKSVRGYKDYVLS